MKMAFLFPLLLMTMGADCRGSRQSESDRAQREATAALAAEANRQAGMPGITNFTEKKFAKYLYELRDQDGFATFTYIVDMNGGLHFVCESIGYGIPYSAQYVSPNYLVRYYGEGVAMPQPEPNGLYVPEGLSATWILCSDGQGGVRAVYSEPELLVSPFQMQAVSSY